jgi:NAD(P)-dependent dehydrogenase (short-subunit alcohol dehydrogenase family)
MMFNNNEWCIILGGSSGFGLATAEKLSDHGMNVCIVHRDRKGAMASIEQSFDNIRKKGVKLVSYNTNALSEHNMQEVLADLKEHLGAEGKIKVLLHSIAFGNLKLLAQQSADCHDAHQSVMDKLADNMQIDRNNLQQQIDNLFEQGHDELVNLASPPNYNNKELLSEEDFTLTVHSMGTSLATWVKAIFEQQLFANDARVLGLTSEGNEVSWKGYAAVSAAKVALEAISRAIAVEYAPFGIRSNIIQAGVTDTKALRLIPGSTHMKATAKLRNPFKRLTTPQAVANFIFLMCLPEAAWVNGDIIRVDGGEHISG